MAHSSSARFNTSHRGPNNQFQLLSLSDCNNGELNAHIPEKLARGSIEPRFPQKPEFKLACRSKAVESYYAVVHSEATESWTRCPEVPTSVDFLKSIQVKGEAFEDNNHDEVKYRNEVNKIDQAWESREEYLRTQYTLLQEDALRPLRIAVARVMEFPRMNEAHGNSTIGIYDNSVRVFMEGFTFSMRGLGAKITFSLNRVGKNIRWAQSKRLISGSLVGLIPKKAPFTCQLAVVAARPIVGLEKRPPEIHLFFPHSGEIDIDSQKEYIMVEERSSFYEAERHTLLALQKMTTESFPLQEHLVKLTNVVLPPSYVSKSPEKELQIAISSMSAGKINILKQWPAEIDDQLDKSQLAALHRILTKQLALVQGPPGTGKTHISVKALQIMIANSDPQDPPIILTCQTNHALDQLLRHVAQFEPEFVRLGGRSKDPDIIKRTIFEVRQIFPSRRQAGSLKERARRDVSRISQEMMQILNPLRKDAELIEPELLQRTGILTEDQVTSLRNQSSDWVDTTTSILPDCPWRRWLGNKLVPVERKPKGQQFFDYEETELDMEELLELEAENVKDDDDDIEALKGAIIEIGDSWTGAQAVGSKISDRYIEDLLKAKNNLWSIKSQFRGPIYAYCQRKIKEKFSQAFRAKAAEYEKAVKQRKIGMWEDDATILKSQKIIGVTTTGFSKYRALISSLRPKVVLIEEAGETLEAHVTATCLDSLEHLILIGDHAQLRPHCHVKELEGEPVNLDISLFERLVKNDVEYTVLRTQRRMIPEISKLLRPIYGVEMADHASVKDRANRPRVPGMGRMSTYFYTHDETESRDDQMSYCNRHEAEMIIAFIEYLVLNGTNPEEISVLTFYNGQRRMILNQLAALRPRVTRHNLHVGTVDSYQGEENEIVILSLVRSNSEGNIGFLDVENRVTVALSHAKRGFYVFGNFQLLAGKSKLWAEVVTIMYKGLPEDKKFQRRIGYYLPLRCTKHNRKTWLKDLNDWYRHIGGCDLKCGETMKCGHECPLRCHPMAQACVCNKICLLVLQCGHPCGSLCSEKCCCNWCASCETKNTKGGRRITADRREPQASSTTRSSEIESWHEFSVDTIQSKDHTQMPTHHRDNAQSRQYLDEVNAELLFGGDTLQSHNPVVSGLGEGVHESSQPRGISLLD